MNKQELIELLNEKLKQVEDVTIDECAGVTTYSTVYFEDNQEVSKDFLIVTEELTIVSNDLPSHLLEEMIDVLPSPRTQVEDLFEDDNFNLLGENSGIIRRDNIRLLFLESCVLLQGTDYEYILDFFLNDLKVALSIKSQEEMMVNEF